MTIDEGRKGGGWSGGGVGGGRCGLVWDVCVVCGRGSLCHVVSWVCVLAVCGCGVVLCGERKKNPAEKKGWVRIGGGRAVVASSGCELGV